MINFQNNYKKKVWKPFDMWLEDQKEEERKQKQIKRWEADTKTQIEKWSIIIIDSRDLLSPNIIKDKGKYCLDVSGRSYRSRAWYLLGWYEIAVNELQRYIPEFDYDPRLIECNTIKL